MHPQRRDIGVSLIVAYKIGKAALQIVAAAALGAAVLGGATAHLHEVAARVTEHGTSRWSLLVARIGLEVTTPRHLEVAILALGLDGALSFLEGWALRRGFGWAPWLIVAATAAAVPFEVASLLRALRWPRLVLLIVNVALVAYLLRRTLREHGPAR